MRSFLEHWLLRLAYLLTALLVLQLAWGGGRLLLLSGPEPIIPAESTLQVEGARRPASGLGDAGESILERPLFWRDRAPYSPPVVVREPKKPEPVREDDSLEDVKLLGTYGVGQDAGIIISDGKQRFRLLRGESLADWELVKPVRDGAYFEKNGEVRKVRLEHVSPGSNKAADGPHNASRAGPDNKADNQSDE